MSSLLREAPPQEWPIPVPHPSTRVDRPAWLLAGLLAVFLVGNLPAFIRMPPDADTAQYDLCAHVLTHGGVLYRDAFDTNLPGMPWLHAAVRASLGWSSEALQAVDVVVVGSLVVLLVGWLPAGASPRACLGTALVLVAFYGTTSEWCRAQRDVWMMLPALLALGLRRIQVRRSCDPMTWGRPWPWLPVAEGVCWGAAFWIKPHVALAALAAWLVGVVAVWRAGGSRVRRLALDALGLLSGGLLAGVPGTAWLVASGAWPSFWDVVSGWNREYVSHDFNENLRWIALAGFAIRFFPWLVLHALAVPAALRELRHAGHRVNDPTGPLLAVVYLAWLAQVVFLQHLFDYVHIPPLLLGITLLCRRVAVATSGELERRALVALLGVCVVFRGGVVTADHLEVWGHCLREGSSPALRDRLSMLPRMNWQDLDGVEEFLRGQGLGDGELTCLANRALPLHLRLGSRPATRYFLMQLDLRVFRDHRDQIYAELAASRQRFVVLDVGFTCWKVRDAAGSWTRSEPRWDDLDRAPFTADRLVFRAGRYAVYALDGPSTRAWVEEHVEF